MEVRCPSGLRGEVRKLKGSEANVLADRKAARKGETYDRILSACWLKTLDPGPYGNIGVQEGERSIPWAKVLVGDRHYALTAIRIATYGPEYVFPVQCRGCNARFEWEIDLEKDITVYDFPEGTVAKIASGDNRFETDVGGRRVVFKILNGADEHRSGKLLMQNKSEQITVALASRIVEVDGVKGRRGVDEWLEGLDLPVQWALLEQFEEPDGGVEQTIEIECPECDGQYEIVLPFEGEGFWIPSTRKQRSLKRKESRKGRIRRFGEVAPETGEDDDT